MWHALKTSGLIAALMHGVLGLATAGALSIASESASAAEPGEAFEQLMENVRYWQARGRPDKAAEAWRKVLKSVPNHPEALAELALFSARAGKTQEAKDYLERLKKVEPRSPRIAGIEQALGLGTKYDDYLAQARKAVQEGRIGEGLELYRKVFGAQAPSGAVGLEYYQTLGGTAGGWEEARAGLERLAAESPNDERYALAFARHLTYVEASRRDGIDRLEKLAGGTQGKAVQAAWRQALLWLLVTPADHPRFDRYLERYPEDADVKKRIADARAGIAARTTAEAERERLQAGYEALEGKDADAAEVIFRKAVKANPRDIDALAGLGHALMRQAKFDEARQLLEKVKDAAPKRRELWEEPLRSAEFWQLVRKAEGARADGQLAAAEALLKEAAAKSPKEAPNADLVLANVMVDAGRYDEAQALFEGLVEKDPKQVPALQGLIELSLRKRELERSIALNQTLAAIDLDAAWSESWLRAELLRRDAADKRAAGLLPEAERLLSEAIAIDPESSNVLLDQTYTYLDLGKHAEARHAIDELEKVERKSGGKSGEPARAPKKGGDLGRDVKVAQAWVLAAELRFEDGLRVLDGLKEGQLDAETKKLKRRMRVQADLSQALKLAGRGKLISAQARLTELQRTTRDAPELMGLVANAWADIGKYDQALAVMYDALSATPNETPTLKLQLAGILHKADREAELLSVLREIEAESNLSLPERQGLANLKIAYAVKRADIAREGGFLARAFNLLQEPLKDYPEDSRLLTALGRLFLSAGEYSEAAELFERVLQVAPDNIEARQGAIQSAVQLGKEDKARAFVEDGLRLSDDDPRMHLVAGRMHVLVGEDGEAMEAFERALALEEGRTAPELPGEPSMSKLLAGAQERFGGGKAAVSEDLGLHSDIVREIEALRSRHAVRLGTSVGIRMRPGTSGYGQLMALDFPTWLSIPTGYLGRLTFTATPVLIDAGAVNLDEAALGSRFGTTGVDLFGQAAGTFGQSLAGIELALREEIGGWSFDVGSSPLGFPRQTVVGGLAWSFQAGALGMKLEGYRRTVSESLLSWAGAEDVATQTTWGGVTRNGGRLDLGITIDDVVWYLVGSGNWLSGERVAENTSFEGGTGLVWSLYDWDGISFGTGLDATAMFFDKNLRHFTYGHGGYFSPQAFASAQFPLRLVKREGDLTYNAQLGLGLVWFREDAAPYYPTDAARQAAREALVNDADEPVEALHPGQEGLAFAFNLDAEISYEIVRGFKLGARARVHTGHDFQEYVGGVFVGYTFQQKVAAPGERRSTLEGE